jgi:ABC-type sugar transport system substrate-binding protein
MAMMDLGFLDGCKDLDVDCELLAGPYVDDATQISNTEQALSLGSSGLVLVAYTPYFKSVDEAAKKLPVVSIHFTVKQEDVPNLKAYTSPDIEGYATESAHLFGQMMKCKGVLAITQSSLNDTENLQSKVFSEVLKADCPKVEILPVQEEGLDSPAAIAKAEAILTANPKITAALSTTGGGSTTWGQALKNKGYKPGEVLVVSNDYTRVNLDLVKAGWVTLLVGQPIYEENYEAVVLLVKMLKGEKVDFANAIPAAMVTIDNVDKYYGYADRVDEMLGIKK